MDFDGNAMSTESVKKPKRSERPSNGSKKGQNPESRLVYDTRKQLNTCVRVNDYGRVT